MSVRDFNKVLIISDALTGDIITQIDYGMFSKNTINAMIENINDRYVHDNEHGISIKLGFKR